MGTVRDLRFKRANPRARPRCGSAVLASQALPLPLPLVPTKQHESACRVVERGHCMIVYGCEDGDPRTRDGGRAREGGEIAATPYSLASQACQQIQTKYMRSLVDYGVTAFWSRGNNKERHGQAELHPDTRQRAACGATQLPSPWPPMALLCGTICAQHSLHPAGLPTLVSRP